MHAGPWWRKLRERDHLEDARHRLGDNIKVCLQPVGCSGGGGVN